MSDLPFKTTTLLTGGVLMALTLSFLCTACVVAPLTPDVMGDKPVGAVPAPPTAEPSPTATTALPTPTPEPLSLVILHTNDVRGFTVPCG